MSCECFTFDCAPVFCLPACLFSPFGVVFVLCLVLLLKTPDFLCTWVLDLISPDRTEQPQWGLSRGGKPATMGPGRKIPNVHQGDQTIEVYARDFVGVARQSATEEACLIVFFWGGLAEPFKSRMPYWHPEDSLEGYVNLALSLSGSTFRMESTPEPAPPREPTESALESAPFREPTQSAPFREPTQFAPFREPTQSAPFREPTQSAPFWEPTQSAPFREPTQFAPSGSPHSPLRSGSPRIPLRSGRPRSPLQSLLRSGSPRSPLQSPLRSGSPRSPLQSPLQSGSTQIPLQSPLQSGSPCSTLQSWTPLRSGNPQSPLQGQPHLGTPVCPLLQGQPHLGTPVCPLLQALFHSTGLAHLPPRHFSV